MTSCVPLKYSWREIIASFWPLNLSGAGMGTVPTGPDDAAVVVPAAALLAGAVPAAGAVVAAAGAVVAAAGAVVATAGAVVAAAGAVVGAAPVVAAGFGVSVAVLPPPAARIAA